MMTSAVLIRQGVTPIIVIIILVLNEFFAV